MPPLVCEARMVRARYDTSADIWSFGILLYELATGKAPYANMSLTKVILTTLHEEAPSLDNTKGKRFSEVSPSPGCPPHHHPSPLVSGCTYLHDYLVPCIHDTCSSA